MTKIASINAALKKYGLQLTQESKKIDVLVFSERKLVYFLFFSAS